MSTHAIGNVQKDPKSISGPGRIVLLSPLEDSLWDRRVSALRGATCFHSAGWMRVLHESYGYAPCCFASIKPEGFGSLLPMMEVSSLLTGRRGVSLPFTDFCEALGTPGCDFQPLVEQAMNHAREHSWKHVEFRGSAGMPDGASPCARHLSHRLDLEKGPEALWSGLDSTARRCIRQARDSGVVISSGNDETAMREFFHLHCLTRKRHGVPPQPYAFFSNIRRYLAAQGLATIFLASAQGGKAIAAALFMHFGKHVIYKFGASDMAFQHLRANHLLMWEAIGRFSSEGMRELHMGRTETAHPGLRRYKLAWGAHEEELVYHRYSPKRGGFVTVETSGSGRSQRIFRRMPVPLSRMIGAFAYRHMA